MGIRELKKELSALQKNELIDIIIDLYRKAPLAKEILDENYSFTNPEDVFQKYKKQISDEFFPKKGFLLLTSTPQNDIIVVQTGIVRTVGYNKETSFVEKIQKEVKNQQCQHLVKTVDEILS